MTITVRPVAAALEAVETFNPAGPSCGHTRGRCSCATPDPTSRLAGLFADWDEAIAEVRSKGEK